MQSSQLLHNNNNLITIIQFSFTVLYQNDNKTERDIGSKYQCLAQRNPKISLNTFSSFSTSSPKQLQYKALHSFVIIYTLL